MYIGRFLVIGGDFCGYCVCSRSFPDRCVVQRGDRISIELRPDAEHTDNPYVAYNCVRREGDWVVIGNGDHVDLIAEEFVEGGDPNGALKSGLEEMGYERDEYNTPRIAGIVGEKSFIGIVKVEGIVVSEVKNPMLVATYGKNSPEIVDCRPDTAGEVIEFMYGNGFENAICAVGMKKGNPIEFCLDNR